MNEEDKKKFVVSPEGTQAPPVQSGQPELNGGAQSSGVSGQGDNLTGRSRLTPNGVANAPQNGSVLSNGRFTTGGGVAVDGNANGGSNTANSGSGTAATITNTRNRRDQVLTDRPFREASHYEQLFEKITPRKPLTAKQLRSSLRREKREKLFSAIGDGISSLANLYFTTQGAPDMYDPKSSLSAASTSRWRQLHKDRQANTEAYINALMKAQQMDDATAADQRNFEYNLYNNQVREAEADRALEMQQAQLAAAAQAEADKREEDTRRWNADYALRQQELEERKIHNRGMRSIAANRARNAGNRSGGRGGSRSGGITLRANDRTSLNLPTQLWNDDNFINEFWERNIKGYNDWNGRGVQDIISATDKKSDSDPDDTPVPFTGENPRRRQLAEKRRQTLGYLLSGDSGYDDEDVLTILGMFDNLDDIYN